MSRAQLVDNDDERSLPSDSQVEDSEPDDRSQATREDESDAAQEPSPRQKHQPNIAQTVNQARQDDRKKGLAISRQLVSDVCPFCENHLTL